MKGVANTEKLVALFDGKAEMERRLGCAIAKGDVR
jgi:hypothetical protein